MSYYAVYYVLADTVEIAYDTVYAPPSVDSVVVFRDDDWVIEQVLPISGPTQPDSPYPSYNHYMPQIYGSGPFWTNDSYHPAVNHLIEKPEYTYIVKIRRISDVGS